MKKKVLVLANDTTYTYNLRTALLKELINNDTILVSIMWVNNIVGSIQPIEEVIKIIKQYAYIRHYIFKINIFKNRKKVKIFNFDTEFFLHRFISPYICILYPVP